MACILRAYGRSFDVDRCIHTLRLEVAKAYRRGEPALGRRKRGRKQRFSGLNLVVSGAGFDQLGRQVGGARRFLRKHARQIKRLRGWPGVEGTYLDFGVEWKPDVVVQSTLIPEDVVALAAKCGLGVEVTMYPSSQDTPEAGSGRRRTRR